MTPDEAHAIAIRYKNLWRGGPATAELEALLIRYDHGTAVTTIAALAVEHEHPPTLAAFAARYRSIDAARIGWERPAYTGEPTALANVIDTLAWRQAHGENVHDLLDVWRRLRPDAVAAAIARHPSQHPNELPLEEPAP